MGEEKKKGFFEKYYGWKNKKEKEPDPYTMSFVCKNCGVNKQIEIPYSQEVSDFVKEKGAGKGIICKWCGCGKLELDDDDD